MSLFHPSHLMAFLESIGRKPNKRLSQNFLIDGNILRKIIQAATLCQGDVIVEIGPGPGVLTEALLKHSITVLAIETDAVFAQALHRLQTPASSLKVFEQDILKFPLEETLKASLKPNQKAKVISNLPYHLTAPIFGKLLPLNTLIESVLVMVQKEVADRLIAKNGSKEYGSFSLFTQFYSTPELLFSVSPHCFYPKPKVTSAIVRCSLNPPPQNIDAALFFKFIHHIFSKRRKMLMTSLKELIRKDFGYSFLSQLEIDETIRPEQLSLEDFLRLFQFLMKRNALIF